MLPSEAPLYVPWRWLHAIYMNKHYHIKILSTAVFALLDRSVEKVLKWSSQ